MLALYSINGNVGKTLLYSWLKKKLYYLIHAKKKFLRPVFSFFYLFKRIFFFFYSALYEVELLIDTGEL